MSASNALTASGSSLYLACGVSMTRRIKLALVSSIDIQQRKLTLTGKQAYVLSRPGPCHICSKV